MDADPWNWTVAEVQQFFRQDAVDCLSDRPTAQLPPLDTFLQSLADSEVDGPSLLDDVDVPALRDDFGISSFRVRGTILHCIRKLKERSKLHRSSNGGLPETPASFSFVPQLASAPDTPTNAEVLPSTEINESVRPGEVQVQDAHGRKRRKLDPSKAQPAPEVLESKVTRYIPDTAISLEELFYGRTELGNEIGTLPSAGEILVEDGDTETADDNFQFHSQTQIPIRAEFVYARMCYFLMNAEAVNLRRQDRPATGILPYSDRMQGKERSATVVQIGADGGEYVAIREQATLLESGYEHKQYQQNATGNSSYLLPKYKHKQDDLDDGLPMFDGSEDGDTTSDSGTSEGDAQMASESEEDERMLNGFRVSELVDNYIDEHIAKWRESNLPRLEATRAWTVWKKTKQSPAFRAELIRSARENIDQLSERLTKLKQRVVEGGFVNEHAVPGACGNLDPSIEDREERKWMIEVWQRRKEPEHTVRPVSKARGNTLQTPATAGAPSFTVHPDDRMSVSPTPVIRAEADSSGEVEGEIFHTPEGSPIALLGADTDGFDGSDEMSLDLSQPAEDTDSSGPESLDDVEDGGSPEHSDTKMLQDQMVVRSSPPQILSVPASAEHSEDRNPPIECPDAVQGVSSSDEMPDISTFMPKRIKHTPRPDTPAKKPLTATQIIDLTGISSDSATPAKPKRQPKTNPAVRKAAPYNFNHQPNEASAMQVHAWEYGDLAGRQDRNRMLIKMLSEVGPEVRDHLHQHQAASRQMFEERIRDAIEHRSLHTSNSDEAMDICARIAIAWYTANPDHWLGSEEPPWARLLQESKQIKNFVNMLASILKLKHSKLFVEAEPGTKAAAKSDPASAALTLSSDTDPVLPRTPLKKRKKPVLATQSAIKARQDAHKRQENYQEVIESQAANTSQVAALNGADVSQSEIVINPARDVDEEDPIFIHSRIARKMKAHQIQGVRFLWREITAVSEEDGAQGCLLAHTMGLGKTMQTIALLVAVVEASESDNRKIRSQLPETLRPKGIRGKRQLRMLVVCPPGLLQNWQCELEQWVPKRLSNVFVVEASSKANQMVAMEDWYRLGGVLLLGYSMLRAFTDRNGKKGQHELDGDRLDKILLDGPDIVVADEAHNLKNPKSKISGVASNFRTHTRIALTGTPMSNDVDEIYALISWVAPDYLGDFRWFQYHFAEPIKAGTWFDSSHAQKRKSLMKLQVLHHDIAPKVDRADITALRGSLKSKTEFVITVSLTEMQKILYSLYINALLGGGRNKKASQVTIFSWLGVLMLLTNHPAPFRSKLLTPARPKKAKKDAAVTREGTPAESDDGSNATSVGASTALPDTTIEQVLDPQAVTGDPGDENLFSLGFTQEMVDSIIDGLEHDTDSELSAKMPIFLSIVDLSHRCHDKVLVFSGSIPTIDYVSELLESQGIPFGRIDGSTPTTKRMQIIESFHRDKFEVLIVSTRAGGVGLNIQGANRVVILDFGFNPTWEEQAIGRAYRLGQTKAVFVYRFVAGGTFETNIYNKQMFKTCLAMRVVDKKNPLRNAQRNTREYLYEPTAVTQENVAQWIGRDPNVLDIILKQHSQDRDTLIRRIETTGTMDEDAEDEPLDEEERKQVREEIQQGSTKQRGRMANAAMSSLNLSAAAALAAARGSWPNGRAMGPPAATQGASRPNGVGGLTPAMRDVQLAPRPPAAAPPSASAPVQRQHSTPAAQSGFRPLPPGE